jgi:hypothetical protein
MYRRFLLVFLAFVSLITGYIPAQAENFVIDNYRYSSAFNPCAAVSGCVLWLDASDAATITETSGLVSQWNDKSGNAYHATQGTGARQPLTGTRSQNSLNVLDFDGGDQLNLPSGLYGLSAGANSAFVVWATDNTSSNQRLLGGYTGTNATRYGFMLNDPSAGSFTVRNYSTGTNAAQTVTYDTNAHIGALRRSGTTLDNIYDGTVSTFTNATDYTMISMTIGAPPDLANPLNGMIAEIIVFNSSLSNADANTIMDYLVAKWGISGVIPIVWDYNRAPKYAANDNFMEVEHARRCA